MRKEREKIGIQASIVGIVVNLVLAALKLGIGLSVGAISIIGDGFNHLTDTAASIISLSSFLIGKRPADKGHPFGHGRIEYIFTSIIGGSIFYVGISLGIDSIQRILAPKVVSMRIEMIGILLFSILVKIGLSIYYKKMGEKITSDLLLAAGEDAIMDVVASFGIIASLGISYLSGYSLDGWVGIFVTLLLVKAGIEIMYKGVNKLLGTSPSLQIVEKIISYLQGRQEIIGIHDLMVHDYGSDHLYGSVHVEMDQCLSLRCAHQIVEEIEDKILKELGIQMNIHIDPVDLSQASLREYRKLIKECLEKIDKGLTFHDLHWKGQEYTSILQVEIALPHQRIDKMRVRQQLVEVLSSKRQIDLEIIFENKLPQSHWR